MSSLPEDPYLALGVDRNATTAQIKAQYRKLALKCHPDKVLDPEKKEEAVAEFHKIQTAFEILGDESKRNRYHAALRLAELRREALVRQSAHAPPAAQPTEPRPVPTRDDRYPLRHSERKSSATPPTFYDYFDPPPRTASRKDDGPERSARRPSLHDERKSSSKSAKESDRAKQESRMRAAARERDRERSRKTYVEMAPDSDSSDDYPVRRDYRREPMPRRDYDDEDRARRMRAQYDEAKEYISRSRRAEDTRHARISRDVDFIPSSGGRPGIMLRRPSGRPKTSAGESRRSSGLDDVDEFRRQANFYRARPSPSGTRPLTEKSRTHTTPLESHPKPSLKRAETMPIPPVGHERSGRRKESVPLRGAGVRRTEHSYGLPTPAPTPDWSGPSARYRYNQEYADDHEYPTPDGYRTARSPSPYRSSARYPSPPPRRPSVPRSTSYIYKPASERRPSMSRENSRRAVERPYDDDRAARRPINVTFSPDGIRYSDRVSSGYSSSKSPTIPSRPSYNRRASYQPMVYSRA